MRRIGFIALLLFLGTMTSLAQLVSFPGAEGYGKYSRGGRNGMVIYVSNLNDAGAGSLRNALESSSYVNQPRTIVFSVSGTIELLSNIEIKNDSYITIAGQTAPGDGISIKGFPIKITDSHDIIIRYIRSRIGDEQDCGSDDGCDDHDAMSMRSSYNIMLDHCSMGWSIDDVLDLTVGTGYSTVQWCLFHEPLVDSKHSKGPHGYIAGWDGASYGSGNVLGGGTYHHNLLASGASRTPRLERYNHGPRDLIDLANNVMYNWGGYGAYGGENVDVNWRFNYYKYGPSTSTRKSMIFHPNDGCQMYLEGNYVYGYNYVTEDNSRGIEYTDYSLPQDEFLQETPFSVWPIEMESAEEAYHSVLSQAGAFVPSRDVADQRIVNDVVNMTGQHIDSQSEVGGWPVLNSTTAPTDGDEDGMPDAWEDLWSLDKANPMDKNMTASNGYTNLEVYLNSIEFNKAVESVSYSYDEEGNILISWNDIYIGEDFYRIERSVDGAAYELIGTVNKNIREFKDNAPSESSDIFYRVIGGQDGIIESPASDFYQEVTSFDIEADTLLTARDTIKIKTIIEPSDATNKLVNWELIQDDDIARILPDGTFIALKAGELSLRANCAGNPSLEAELNFHIEPNSSNSSPWEMQVKVYPNPSHDGTFFVELGEYMPLEAQVRILDMSGRLIHTETLPGSGKQSLNHTFARGIYMLQYKYNDIQLSRKIMVM